MAPWDAGGIHDDRCQLHEVIRTMMLQWLMRPLCGPVIVHGLNRNMTMDTENELDMIILIDTDSPHLTVAPGECYASDGSTQIRCDLRHTHNNNWNRMILFSTARVFTQKMFPPNVMRIIFLRR